MFVLFVFGLSIAVTVGLYLLIESETSNPTVVDRQTAERQAREQGGLRQHRRRPDRDEGAHDRRAESETDASDDREFGWDER